jgi:hypothetical protein
MVPAKEIERRTLLLQEDAAFGNNDWDVAIYVALAMLIDEGDGHICICYTLAKGHAEYTL